MKTLHFQPWDFTVYLTETGEYIIKVMFSEGDYKVDIERYYNLTTEIGLSEQNKRIFNELSEDIRKNPSIYKDKEISPGEIKKLLLEK
ncbi:hypothetical protein [Serratia rubidaea]|uniref:hypothetical protein n=1 Tax=Serratia rubidaea TaxID=61652 RepID=UPI0022B88AB6|nr:hypothetical protein [Serratia rubidaea]WBF47080.1 hypothetical protein OLD77_08545 [Serratia rubidaea]